MQAYRQGDVSIVAVEGLPKRAKRVRGEPILARARQFHSHSLKNCKFRSLYKLFPYLPWVLPP